MEMSVPQPVAVTRPPGPSLRLAILLMVAGAVLAVPTLVAGIIPITRSVSNAGTFVSPGPVVMHLGKGTYMVYEFTSDGSFDAPFNNDDVTISPADVTVTGPTGLPVNVFDRGSLRETCRSNGGEFVGAARFTTPTDGLYTIAIRSATPTGFAVARPLSAAIRKALAWFALVGVGGIAFVVGVVLLIVGSVRRSQVAAAPAFAYGAAPAPGWHPDPWGAAQLRYWDGNQWTGHTQ